MTGKLIEVLSRLWSNPLFGDSYPSIHQRDIDRILGGIATIHRVHIEKFHQFLQEYSGLSLREIDELVQDTAIKGTAFCAAIPRGEIEDIERLAEAALSIDILCWSDQRLDRGDPTMLSALECVLSNPNANAYSSFPTASTEANIKGLQCLRACIPHFAASEDVEPLADYLFNGTLRRQLRVVTLSRIYAQDDSEAFWERHAADLAENAVLNVGLVYTTAALYSIYRLHRPHLPSVANVFDDPFVIPFLEGSASTMIRVFDDAGDRGIDRGTDHRWGQFTLNLFNQPHRLWQRSMYEIATRTTKSQIDGPPDISTSAALTVCKFFADAALREYAAIPPETKRKHQVFLTISKRLLEAGYVNGIGDIALSTSSHAQRLSIDDACG